MRLIKILTISIFILIILFLFDWFMFSKNFADLRITNILSIHSSNKKLSKELLNSKKELEELKNINQELKTLENLNERMSKHIPPYEYDAYIKENLFPLVFPISEKKQLNYNNLEVNIFKSSTPFLTGIDNKILSGSAYLDTFDNKLFLLSATGIIGFSNIKPDEIHFKQIQNNIENFINENQFKKGKQFSIKDLKIFNNKVYVSYTEEKYKDCWTTSIIYSDLDYDELTFRKLFSPEECIPAVLNQGTYEGKLDISKEFNAWQSGGRIIEFDDRHVLLTVGDYRARFLAQKNDSLYGKILKININTAKSELISKGHRNPQGLLLDKNNNFILSTEHGPKGGDEINLIEFSEKNLPNYGWPIASYGEHYDQQMVEDGTLDSYPLLKSHEENGFIEPLKYFVPSIGISEIISLNRDKRYIVSSMRDKSLYFFNLDNNNKIELIERVEIGERIRDLLYYNNQVFMFLENTVSIGIISLSKKLN